MLKYILTNFNGKKIVAGSAQKCIAEIRASGRKDVVLWWLKGGTAVQVNGVVLPTIK